MVSTFTPNINLEEPARGDDVGTWDTPVNNNSTLLDLIVGGITTISGAAGSVVLAAAQFQASGITFNSTLLASITVTFPTSFKKPYHIRNTCTGSSAFVVTLQTTAAGGQVICAPPGESIDVVNDGVNLYYHNMGRIGEYWDYAGSSVPGWVSGCTIPPYVACVGGTISSATYPILFSMIGAGLPDSRARNRMYLDAGTNRVTSSNSNVAGNTLFAAGGSELVQQHNHSAAVVDPGHTHNVTVFNNSGGANTASGGATQYNAQVVATTASVTGISVNIGNYGNGFNSQNMVPTYVGGITMIRAG